MQAVRERDLVPHQRRGAGGAEGATNAPALRQAVAVDLDLDGWADAVSLGSAVWLQPMPLYVLGLMGVTRRVSRFETLDAADLNRIMVMMNRNQILNSRGALA